jgi:hypothetical protein
MTASQSISTSDELSLCNGRAWAGILAAGIGCATFGLLVVLAEASKQVSDLLNFYKPAGDLSGKTTVAICVWIIAWGLLYARWKARTIRSTGVITVTVLILIAIGLLAVFPPVFELFARP